MAFIDEELKTVKTKCEALSGTTVEAAVRAIVRVKIIKTDFKQLTIVFQFPNNYPQCPIVHEIKSAVFSFKLLDGLSKMCDEELKKIIGQQQVFAVVQMCHTFLEENPLCVCSDEISTIKRDLLKETDEIKLKQKTSKVIITLREEQYFLSASFSIPDNYPVVLTNVEITESNFPKLLEKNFKMQSVEIARKCVVPPLKKKPKDPPFEPRPALHPVVQYLTKEIIRKYPHEKCPLCSKPSLPPDPSKVKEDPKHGMFVERVYCTHLYHIMCLHKYMKTPPFTGGKRCPTCGNRIYHEKFKATPELQEARWAHKEARQRELEEVVDFLD